MSRIVAKFGGSSLADTQHIMRVADIVIALRNKGHDLVIIVSAMLGQTDYLIQLAHEVADQPCQREYDALLSTGEQVSAALLASCLIEKGYPACSLNAFQVPIHTNCNHRNAKLSEINNRKLLENLRLGLVSVLTGFQGISEEGDLTTLGRGGSDLTAVAIAAVIEADECRIYSDVDGVFTCDPHVIHDAKQIAALDFSEMFELASSGANILQSRAAELATKYHVPLHILSSFKPKQGTLIHFDKNTLEQPVVTAITSDSTHCAVSLTKICKEFYQSGGLLSSLASKKIEIDMLQQQLLNQAKWVSIFFIIRQESISDTKELINKFAKTKHEDCHYMPNLAKVSVIGVGMKSHMGIASRIFMVLNEHGIQVHFVNVSEIKISVLIDAKYSELSVRYLNSCFFSNNAQVAHPV